MHVLTRIVPQFVDYIVWNGWSGFNTIIILDISDEII